MRGSPSLVVLPLSGGVGVWKLHLIIFLFFNVWSAVRLDFSPVGHVRQFSIFECFGSWNPGGVAHVDIVLESVPSFQPVTIIG